MSNVIDQKVVEMKFDNSNFERNVKTSMNTLEKLNSALDVTGSTKALEELGSASNHLASSGLASTIGEVGNKFKALETIAVGALLKIGSQAVETGERLIKSLSTDNISAGWDKFGEKTRAVGTLISQGFSMKEVESQLSRLAWFTDETSYNFTEMVNSIAKFTATGKGLTDSTTALEGVALWAAMSGQNAQKASAAMYQLSQAMGSGVMRKEDYKSIQNLNMDTDEFRQKALDAAVAAGTLKKVGKDTYQSLMAKADAFNKSQFADHLTKDAWFTSKVMMEVFKEYSSTVDDIYDYAEKKGLTASEAIEELNGSIDEFGLKAFRAAQEARTWGDVVDSVKDAVSSTWMETFEMIFGNYEEATELFTRMANDLYDVFAEGGNQRNALLEEWKELGGRTYLIEGLYRVALKLVDAVNLVKEAFRAVFPEKTAYELRDLSLKFYNLTGRLKLSEEATDNLRDTFSGLFSIGKLVLVVITDLVRALVPSLKSTGSLVDTILKVTGALGRFISGLTIFIQKEKLVERGVKAIKKAILSLIGLLITAAVTIVSAIVKFFQLEPVKAIINGIITAFKALIAVIALVITKTGQLVSSFIQITKTFTSNFFNSTQSFFKKLVEYIGKAKTAVTNFVNAILSHFPNVKKLFESISESFSNVFSKWGEKDVSFFDKLKDSFAKIKDGLIGTKDAFGEFFKNLDMTKVLAIALTTGVVLLALSFSKLLNSVSDAAYGVELAAGKIGKFFGTMTNFFKKQSMINFSNYARDLAVSIGILVASLYALSKMGEQGSLWPAFGMLAALTGLLIAFAGAMFLLNKAKLGDGAATASILAIAAAMGVMAGVLYLLNSVTVGPHLLKKIGYLGLIMAELAAVSIAMTYSKAGLKSAIVLLAFSISISKIVKSLTIVSSMDLDTIHDHLLDLVVIIGLIGLLGIAAGNIGLGSVIGLVAIGAALMLFSEELSKLIVSLDPTALIAFCDTYKVGLIAFIAVLGLMAFAMSKMGQGVERFGKGMLGVSFSILALVGVCKLAGLLNEKDLINGIICLTVFGALISVLELLSGKTKDASMIKFAASLIIITGCMFAMLALIGIVGLMTVGQVIAGIAVMAALTLMIGHLEKMSSKTRNVKITPLLGLVSLLLILFTSLVILTGIVEDNGVSLIGSLGIALSVLVGIYILIDSLSKMKANKNTDKITGMLFSVVGALSVLMGSLIAIVAITGKDPNGILKLLSSGGAIVGILWSLYGIIKLLSKINFSNNKDINNKINLLKELSILLISLSASLLILSTQPWYKIGISFIALSAMLWEMVGVIAVINKIKLQKNSKIIEIVKAIDILSLSLIAISASLKILCYTDWKKFTPGLIACAGVFTAFLGVIFALDKIVDGGNVLNIRDGLIDLNVLIADLYLVGLSLRTLTGLHWSDFGAGLSACAASFSVMLGIIWSLQKLVKATDMPKVAEGLVAITVLAIDMIIVAQALKQLVGFDWETISVGLISALGAMAVMTGILAIIAAISATGVGTLGVGIAIGAVAALAISFIGLAAACYILAKAFSIFVPALKELTSVDTASVAKQMIELSNGITKIGWALTTAGMAALGLIGIATAVLIAAAAFAVISVSLPKFAAGLELLAQSMNRIKDLDCGKIAKQMAKLALGIAAIAVASALLVVGALAILTMSIALAIAVVSMTMAAKILPEFTAGLEGLVPALIKLKDSSPLKIAGSLVALAFGIAALGLASVLLVPLGIVMISFGFALIEMAIAMGIVALVLPRFVEGLNTLPDKQRLLDMGAGLIEIGKGLSLIGLGALLASVAIAILAIAVPVLALGLTLLNMALEPLIPTLNSLVETLNNFISVLFNYDMSDFALKVLALSLAIGALGIVAALTTDPISSLGSSLVGFGEDLEKFSFKISNAIDNVVTKLTEGFETLKTKIGGFVGEITEIIDELIESMSGGIESIREFLNTRTGDIGYNVAAGVAKGITKGGNSVTKSVLGMCSGIIATFRSRDGMDINSPSEKLAKWGIFLPAGVAKGIDDGWETVKKSMNNMCDNGILAPLIEKLSEGTLEVSDFVDTISGLFGKKNNFIGQFKSAEEAIIGNAEAGNKLNVVVNYLKGTFGDLFKETNLVDKAMEALGLDTDALGLNMEDLEEKTKKVKSAFETLQETVQNQMSLFSKFEEKSELTGEQLLENMKSQVEGVARWAYNVAGLADKGIDQGLLQKLAEMGPQGSEYVHAFMQMTKEQLAQANEYFANSLTLPTSSAALITDSYKACGEWIKAGLDKGIDPQAGVTKLQETAMNQMTAFKEKWGIASPAKEAIQMSAYICEGFKIGIDDNIDSVIYAMRRCIGKLFLECKYNSHYALTVNNYKQFGENIVKGIIKGIEDNAEEAVRTTLQMILDIYQYTCKLLKIKPPSELFETVGKNIVYGIIYGIVDSFPSLTDILEALVENVANGLDFLSDTFGEFTPLIKPEIELTGLETGNSIIDDLLSGSDYSINLANSVSNDITRTENDKLNQIVRTDNTDVVNAIEELRSDVEDLRNEINTSNENGSNVNVELTGEAANIFNVVKVENNRYYKQHGASPLLT